MNIKKSLNLALADADMSRVELAKILGVSKQRVYAISRQKTFMPETITAVAGAFDMKVSEFIALGE